jgi:ABC-type multidrug transport system fused ATPase/permease subunit
MSLPDGYATLLGERGVNLSGGQRQRLALARSLLAAPDVLVLDEAKSAIDGATERAIRDATLARNRAMGRTEFFSWKEDAFVSKVTLRRSLRRMRVSFTC